MEATLPPEVAANVFDQDDPAELRPTRASLAHNRYPFSSSRVGGTRACSMRTRTSDILLTRDFKIFKIMCSLLLIFQACQN